jgi:hypothetical protein
MATFFGSWANAQPTHIALHQPGSNSRFDGSTVDSRQSPVNQLDKDGQTFALELAAPIYGDIATEFYDSSSSQLSRSVSGLRSSQRALQPTRRGIEDGYNALRRLSSILFLLTARRQTARIYILDEK